MQQNIKSERGEMILELAIVLPVFIFMIMFLYGLFVVNTAENEITHALIQSSKSLSLDSYITERYDSAAEMNTFWGGLNSLSEDCIRLMNDPFFSSSSDWYDSDNIKDSSIVQNTVERRFIGFFSGGDVEKAQEKLESFGIKNGISGLKFNVKSTSDNLEIKVSYTIQIWFDYWGIGRIPLQHTVKAKMW